MSPRRVLKDQFARCHTVTSVFSGNHPPIPLDSLQWPQALGWPGTCAAVRPGSVSRLSANLVTEASQRGAVRPDRPGRRASGE